MQSFPLQIVTPEGMAFDGQVQRLIVRSVEGEIGILASHMEYATALSSGRCRVTGSSGREREAECGGGVVSVGRTEVCITTPSFQWCEGK